MKSRILKEMLTERDGAGRSYSQSRIYLLVSVISYYLTLGFASVKGLRPDITIDVQTLKVIIDALQWAMMLFAGYTFGGKGLEVIKVVLGKTANAPAPTTDPVPAPEPAPTPAPDALSK